MEIYNTPSIYKNGLSEDDLNKLVTLSNGIDFDIIGKLSSYVQDIPLSRLYVKYNPIIGLININGFFNLKTPAPGGSNIKLYDFNTDLPIFTIGGNNRGFIHADSTCICNSLGNYKNAIIKYRPCQTSTYNYGIYAEASDQIDIIMSINDTIFINPEILKEFNEYVKEHIT